MSPDLRVRAFPGMSPLMLKLLASGDLQRELPDWQGILSASYAALSGWHTDERLKRSWRVVLAAYDEATVPQAEDVQ